MLGSRILLVDDSATLRERLARAFRERSFVVDTAGDYDEAIASARAVAPDMAVIDLRMPGRSGMEVLRDLLSIAPDCRVLVLSGYGSIATAIDAIRLGAVNFLPKPADADDILTAFERSESDPFDVPPVEHEVPSLARTEWEHIHRVMSECGGNISKAARRLGIHRRSLQRKLQKRAPD